MSRTRNKHRDALRQGRLLRNSKGHIVTPQVVRTGVFLTPAHREVLCRTLDGSLVPGKPYLNLNHEDGHHSARAFSTTPDQIQVGDKVTTEGPDGTIRELTVKRVAQSGIGNWTYVQGVDGGLLSFDPDWSVTIVRPPTKE